MPRIKTIYIMAYFVKLDFKSKKDSPLDTFAQGVLKSMTDNPDFVSIKDLVENDLKNAVTGYSAALVACKLGGKPATAAKNSKRAALLDLLSIVARHVDLIANGNEAIILGSGFSIGSTEKTKVPDIAKGNIVYAKRAEAPCEVEVLLEPLEGVNQYAIEWSVDGKTWFNGTYSSKKRVFMTTTYPKTDTMIRYRGLGLNERMGPWSDLVSVFIV